MSSSVAEMTIGSNTFKVLNADISYYQLTQIGGRASSDIRGGTFTVAIESSDGPRYDQLAEWMFSKSAMKKGVIRFYKKDGVSRLFDFEFYDAYCIKYAENFNYSDNQPMMTMLTISPGITRIMDLVKERPWKVSDLSSQNNSISFIEKAKTNDNKPMPPSSVNVDHTSADGIMSSPTATNGPFATPDEAAKGALKVANPQSIKDNLEYSGLIYQGTDGKYYFTGPAKGTDQGANPLRDAPAPADTSVVGDYHTHADYSTADLATGAAIRTNDPSLDQFNSDNFSRQDKKDNQELGYPGYLGTPSGKFRKYDPTNGNDILL